MTSAKRKQVDSEPDDNEAGKKMRVDEDKPGFPILQSKAVMIQGPDDSSIERLFTSLYYTIITFAGHYFKGAPYAIARKQDQKVFFEGLAASDSKEYLKSKHPGAKEAIIVAAIWNKLIGPLLSAPTRAFNDAIPEKTIKNRTLGARDEFYAWRTLTAHFLSNNYEGSTSWGEKGTRREEFVDEMVSLLLDHSVIKDEGKLGSGLDGIADEAYELATAMARSRAYWVCTMKDPRIGQLHGFEIKTDRMDDVDLWNEKKGHGKSTTVDLAKTADLVKTVDLVKTPMLLKFGNSDGRNYNQCRVVKKAEVVVKLEDATA